MILLTNQGKVAFISPEDGHLLRFKWTATLNTHYKKEKWYLYRKMKNRNIYFHREVLKPPPGFGGEHKDGNGLNNRRWNLEIMTQSDNIARSNKLRSQFWGRKEAATGGVA